MGCKTTQPKLQADSLHLEGQGPEHCYSPAGMGRMRTPGDLRTHPNTHSGREQGAKPGCIRPLPPFPTLGNSNSHWRGFACTFRLKPQALTILQGKTLLNLGTGPTYEGDSYHTVGLPPSERPCQPARGGREAVVITPILQALTATRAQGPPQCAMLTLLRKNLPATYPFKYPPWDLSFAFTECFPAAIMGAEDVGTLNFLRFRVPPSPTSMMPRKQRTSLQGTPRLVKKRPSCPLAGHPGSAGGEGLGEAMWCLHLACTLGSQAPRSTGPHRQIGEWALWGP